jgi:hypothetical protein
MGMTRSPRRGVLLALLACLLAPVSLAQEPGGNGTTPPANETPDDDAGDVDVGLPEEALGDAGEEGLAGARFGTTTLVILLVLAVVVVGLIVALGARRP